MYRYLTTEHNKTTPKTGQRRPVMAKAKKGSCGGTPRVGKKGDPKPARGGRGTGQGRRK